MALQHRHAQLSLQSPVPSKPNRQKWNKGQETRCKPGASSGPGEGHSRSASHQWVGGGLASLVTTWWRADPTGAEPPAHQGSRNIPAPEGARCRGQALLSPVCRPATESLTWVRPRDTQGTRALSACSRTVHQQWRAALRATGLFPSKEPLESL